MTKKNQQFFSLKIIWLLFSWHISYREISIFVVMRRLILRKQKLTSRYEKKKVDNSFPISTFKGTNMAFHIMSFTISKMRILHGCNNVRTSQSQKQRWQRAKLFPLVFLLQLILISPSVSHKTLTPPPLNPLGKFLLSVESLGVHIYI